MDVYRTTFELPDNLTKFYSLLTELGDVITDRDYMFTRHALIAVTDPASGVIPSAVDMYALGQKAHDIQTVIAATFMEPYILPAPQTSPGGRVVIKAPLPDAVTEFYETVTASVSVVGSAADYTTMTVHFHAVDEYELAQAVMSLESELAAQFPDVCIPRPTLVTN